jgi:hypothetical protein
MNYINKILNMAGNLKGAQKMHLKIDLMDSWQVAATSSPQRVTVDHFSI